MHNPYPSDDSFFKSRVLYPPPDMYAELALKSEAVVLGSCRIGSTTSDQTSLHSLQTGVSPMFDVSNGGPLSKNNRIFPMMNQPTSTSSDVALLPHEDHDNDDSASVSSQGGTKWLKDGLFNTLKVNDDDDTSSDMYAMMQNKVSGGGGGNFSYHKKGRSNSIGGRMEEFQTHKIKPRVWTCVLLHDIGLCEIHFNVPTF